MSDTRNAPRHPEKDEALVRMQIGDVRVMIRESETTLNLHHPKTILFSHEHDGILQELTWWVNIEEEEDKCMINIC